jgi:hypothetical protein
VRRTLSARRRDHLPDKRCVFCNAPVSEGRHVKDCFNMWRVVGRRRIYCDACAALAARTQSRERVDAWRLRNPEASRTQSSESKRRQRVRNAGSAPRYGRKP